jgi:hypothetical protein
VRKRLRDPNEHSLRFGRELAPGNAHHAVAARLEVGVTPAVAFERGA